jgi:hypothetical protein
VELYGDPLWERTGPPYPAGTVQTYKGVARVVESWTVPHPSPYADRRSDSSINPILGPAGPGDELSDRWQSRCLKGDAVCGESDTVPFAVDPLNQLHLVLDCGSNPNCVHRQYAEGRDTEFKDGQWYPATKLAANGAKFLALKTFPELFTSHSPSIAHVETFVEGVHVYFRLYYTDPKKAVNGFSFSWNGGEVSHFPFSNAPYWARVVPLDASSTGRIDSPFNHLCGHPEQYESVVQAWLDHCTGGNCIQVSPGIKIHMSCDARNEEINPFFDH